MYPLKGSRVEKTRKQSILEKTNSWKTFIDEATSAVQTRDYRKSVIASILFIVDPEEKMWPGSFWRYAKGLIIGTGFLSGREALFQKPFERFISKNKHLFENAPLPAVRAYNQLVIALFSQKTAASLCLDERIGRRYLSVKERIVKKGEEAKRSLFQRLFMTTKPVETTQPVKLQIERELPPPAPTSTLPQEVPQQIVRPPKDRTQDLAKIEEEKARLSSLIAPFAQTKDFKKEVELFLNQLAILGIDDSIFQKKTDQEIDFLIRQQMVKLRELSTKITSRFQVLIEKTAEFNQVIESTKTDILASRFEIFSASTPYPDLLPTILSLKDRCIATLQSCEHSLKMGTMSFDEWQQSTQSLLYDPDVRLIRGELTARSLRLKDVRNSLRDELLNIDQEQALLRIAGIASHHAAMERDWLIRTLQKLFNPYTIFQDTYNPDSINILFRHWWVDIERIKSAKTSKNRSFFSLLDDHAHNLLRPIARSLDTIEKVQGTSYLYASFVTCTKGQKRPLSSIISWLHDNPLFDSLFLHLVPLEHAEQHRLIERLVLISSRKTDLIKFATSIRAAKNFEPERIDSILEAFSLFSIVTSCSLESHIRKIENLLDTIETELIKEIGFIGTSARAGYAYAQLLPNALTRIPSFLARLASEFASLEHENDPNIATLAAHLQKQVNDLILQIGNIDQEKVSDAFRRISTLIFQRNLLTAAKHKLLLSTSLLSSGIDKVFEEISKNKLFKTQSLAFIPGDLNYFLENFS